MYVSDADKCGVEPKRTNGGLKKKRVGGKLKKLRTEWGGIGELSMVDGESGLSPDREMVR